MDKPQGFRIQSGGVHHLVQKGQRRDGSTPGFFLFGNVAVFAFIDCGLYVLWFAVFGRPPQPDLEVFDDFFHAPDKVFHVPNVPRNRFVDDIVGGKEDWSVHPVIDRVLDKCLVFVFQRDGDVILVVIIIVTTVGSIRVAVAAAAAIAIAIVGLIAPLLL